MRPKTGWPPGLLQDDSRALSKWLANRQCLYCLKARSDHALPLSPPRHHSEVPVASRVGCLPPG
jgi:hypothetical protein